ncbi:MAG: nucleoside monophosphate kinase [Bryobacter sp.]|nr:nucleoside monophosphate kinase [Bryobacter sp.]
MILLLFGPPGCGKGTQAPMLSERLGLPAISTGELLRQAAKQDAAAGRAIDELLAQGNLASDEVVNALLEARLAEADCKDGFLIDGYPRTVEQASHLLDLLDQLQHERPVLIHLDVPEQVVVERLSARWNCPDCGAIYNVLTKPPMLAGHCDADAKALVQRKDDTVETARKRLAAYRALTDPVLAYFESSEAGAVVHVNGNQAPEEVFADIKQRLEREVFAFVRKQRRA